MFRVPSESTALASCVAITPWDAINEQKRHDAFVDGLPYDEVPAASKLRGLCEDDKQLVYDEVFDG